VLWYADNSDCLETFDTNFCLLLRVSTSPYLDILNMCVDTESHADRHRYRQNNKNTCLRHDTTHICTRTYPHTLLSLAFTTRVVHARSHKFVTLTFNASRHIIQNQLIIELKMRIFEHELCSVFLMLSGKNRTNVTFVCIYTLVW